MSRPSETEAMPTTKDTLQTADSARIRRLVASVNWPLRTPGYAVRSGQLLGVDFLAQAQARGADGGIAGKLAGWVVEGGGKAGDVAAVLAAEAAPLWGPAFGNGLQRT